MCAVLLLCQDLEECMPAPGHSGWMVISRAARLRLDSRFDFGGCFACTWDFPCLGYPFGRLLRLSRRFRSQQSFRIAGLEARRVGRSAGECEQQRPGALRVKLRRSQREISTAARSPVVFRRLRIPRFMRNVIQVPPRPAKKAGCSNPARRLPFFSSLSPLHRAGATRLLEGRL